MTSDNRKNILLITNTKEKYYFYPFIEKCDLGSLSINIFYLDKFPAAHKAVVHLRDLAPLSGFLDVEEYVSGDELKRRLPLESIDVAWFLRAGNPKPHDDLGCLEKKFTRDESWGAINSIFRLLDCKWINKKDKIDDIENSKLYQQFAARKCDLKTPHTLISNDHPSVIEFARDRGHLLLKTLANTKLDPDGQFFIYSQKIEKSELEYNVDSISFCPIFCQEYIEKLYEYRVMVIGGEILACRIDSQASEKTKIDWRHYDHENVEHIRTTLPNKISERLLRLMVFLDIRYGAIDLIETPDREFVFLEVNPSGQWEWISHYAGLPIADAVADMLLQT